MKEEIETELFTPLDIRTKEFKKGVAGYSPKEVVHFLDAVAKQWERILKKLDSLKSLLDHQEVELKTWYTREAELAELKARAIEECQAIKKAAQQEAENLMKEVEQRAQDVRAQTEIWLEQTIAHVEDLEKKKSNFLTAFRSALDSHYEWVSHEQVHEPLSQELTSFLHSAENLS